MNILVLTSSYLAPTYNQRILSQVDYINSFAGINAELENDLPLYEAECKIMEGSFDCVFPAVVFEYAPEKTQRFTFNTALYKMLLYHRQEFIGSDIFTQLLLNDKALTSYRSGMGLPCRIITRALWENRPNSAMALIEKSPWPVLVKPNTLSASLGISRDAIAYDKEDAAKIIERQFKNFPSLSELLLEHYLEEAKEYTVSVTGTDPWVITAPTALKSLNEGYEIYSFDNKRMAIQDRPVQYATVSDLDLADRLSSSAKKLAQTFGLRDYCRFDFLADPKGQIFLIDANTIPALGRNYLFPYVAEGVIAIEQLLALLLAAFSKRTGIPLPNQFLQSLPVPLLTQLGF